MFSSADGRKFLHYVLPAVIRPLRIVWNQIIGFLFVVLAAAALPPTIHSAREFNGDLGSLFRLVISGIFIAGMAGFGVHSFWRAYRVPKSR